MHEIYRRFNIYLSELCLVALAGSVWERSWNKNSPWGFKLAGVSNLSVFLGHTGRIRAGLGHTWNTQTLMKTNKQKSHNVLRKFMMLCWAAFIANVGCTRLMGRGWDTPERKGFLKTNVLFGCLSLEQCGRGDFPLPWISSIASLLRASIPS